MNVKDIVKKYLEENNFDGLVNRGECACKKEGLFPCSEMNEFCEAGKIKDCNGCEHKLNNHCDLDYNFCIE